MKSGGIPFVLAEKHGWLKRIAFQQLKTPALYWQKLASSPPVSPKKIPRAALKALRKLLPDTKAPTRIVVRQAGLGSRGHQRFVALQNYRGGLIAREAKALVPTAKSWVKNKPSSIRYSEILKKAVVSRSVFPRRRQLAGSSSRPRLHENRNGEPARPTKRGASALLHGLGNRQRPLGTKGAPAHILKDLRKRKAGWLYKSAKAMGDAILNDWKDWRKNS